MKQNYEEDASKHEKHEFLPGDLLWWITGDRRKYESVKRPLRVMEVKEHNVHAANQVEEEVLSVRKRSCVVCLIQRLLDLAPGLWSLDTSPECNLALRARAGAVRLKGREGEL